VAEPGAARLRGDFANGFAGRLAVITGGGSGIGAGLCRALVARGARVVCVDRDEAAARRTCDALGDAAIAARVDVTDAAALASLARDVARTHGPVHLLFANAGVLRGGLGVGDDPELLRLHFDVNVMGVANTVHAFIEPMRAHDEPAHVVLTASIGGFLAGPDVGAYCVSKFAVVGLGEAMRGVLAASGIGLSTLCPGAVRTHLLEQPEATFDGAAPPAGFEAAVEGGLEPADVAEIALGGVQAGLAHIFTHPAFEKALAARFERVLHDCSHTGG
jgi:NAD(P)-dependent dehydrogenase (short-subunit alcohol dehydrogenase family)